MTQLVMRRPNLEDLPEVPALPPGFVLREFELSDAEALAALLQKAFEDDTWTVERLRSDLIEASDVRKIFVITRDGVLVATGSAALREDRYPEAGYVHWVAADPALKGMHLGYIVSLAVLHEFVRLGCKTAVLQTDDDRLPAIRTYQKLGFEPEHTHESHPGRWARIMSDLLAAANL